MLSFFHHRISFKCQYEPCYGKLISMWVYTVENPILKIDVQKLNFLFLIFSYNAKITLKYAQYKLKRIWYVVNDLEQITAILKLITM